jgi:hypothetical protein
MDLQPLSKIFHFVNTTHFVSNVWTHASHDLLNWMSWVSTAEMRLASGHDASFSSPSLSFPAVQLKNVFRLADDSYMKSVEHRGGWASILRRMITEGSISKDGRVLLLDIVEKWFYWSIIDGKPNPAIDTDWIGILHYVGGLPGHLPEIAKLESVLKVQTFRDSLPFCKGIIVLSLSQKKWLQTHFIQRGGYQVPIIALKHPIGSPDMRQFSMSGFINSENGRKVIALGTQYRKTATIYQMKVPYAKAWLPGTKDQKKIAWLRGHDFQALNYYPDLSSVDIMYTDSANEYDKMLVENIIVIDMWGASANNAVLECIASNTPFFVTALEAVKEYVGSSYPLLFNHYSEVERIVNNTRLLYESYRAAHRYLVALDKSALSTERFIESLVLASKGKYLSVPQTANLLVDNTRMDSLLLVVCGHGKAERTPVLQASIEHLVNSVSQNPSFRFRCLLYVHELTIFQNAVEHFPMCKVVLNKGKLWVSHMLQVGVVREDYVALLMDDIDIRGTNVFRMVNELKRVNFDVISSAIPGWHYKALLPRPECQSHRVAFVDMLFAVMTRNAWNCWQSQLDLSINHFGWGYDATFASLCGVKIGVSDMDTSQHAGHECATGGECTRTYDSSQAMDQLHNWLMLVYKLKTPKDVFERLKNMSETQYGYCEF